MRLSKFSISCFVTAARVLLAVSCLLLGTLFAGAAPDPAFRAAVIRTGPAPGVRYSSGLTIYDEEFRNGRLLSRYWGSNGQIVPDAHLQGENDVMDTLPVDTFRLEIEGQELSGTWKWIGASKTEVKDPDGLLVTIELESSARPVRVKVHTLLSGGPVMVRWLEVTNSGKKATAISNVSPWAGQLWHTPNYSENLPAGAKNVFEVGYAQYQQWGQEGAWKFEPVVNETKIITGDRGKSGWGHPSFFARNNVTGEWFVASLGWSNNWKIGVTSKIQYLPMERADSDARLFFSMGPRAVDPALRVLDPGETVKTPETHILCMKSDLDHVIQAMIGHVRKNVLPATPSEHAFDVEANHRGYIFDHESEEGFKREIDMAADIGAEMFVIDAGWYGPEPNHWFPNAGDWYAGAWLPNDLQPIREYARKKGLRFGLWMEPEAIGPATKLAKEHPDWILKRNGQPVTKSRNLDAANNNRNLDVANPAVAKWMESEIARIIEKYDLDMFRIDYNTTAEEGGNRVQSGFVESSSWRYVDNLYAMFDRLRKRFPKVIFQNCAGGGGRLDYGILRRFDTTELSDWMRGPRGLKVLNGMTWLLPPEILLRTFGTEVPDLESDGNVESQLAMVQMSLPIFRGISPSLGELNPILRDKIRSGVELYKTELRPILRGSSVFHHTPVLEYFRDTPWLVLEYATPNAQQDVTTLFRTSNFGDSVFHLLPRGLDASRNYKVTFQSSGETVRISGLQLMQQGLKIRLETAGTSEMLLFHAEEQ
ncbi:MAG: alpha-galactosidase [Acidobacteria bacterium]|nr:alpha-galactosidase [Acidobacteriota bacterium]